jgi:hypothetical protein
MDAAAAVLGLLFSGKAATFDFLEGAGRGVVKRDEDGLQIVL